MAESTQYLEAWRQLSNARRILRFTDDDLTRPQREQLATWLEDFEALLWLLRLECEPQTERQNG